jgi:hypothetical protein
VLFLISTTFFLFFNPVTLRKPFLKIANSDKKKKKDPDRINNE